MAEDCAEDMRVPKLIEDLQTKLDKLNSSQETNALCEICDSDGVLADTHCYQCHQNLCEDCIANHQRISIFAHHKTVPLSEELFCKDHNEVVTAFCDDCKCLICAKCALKTHREHSSRDLQALAQQSLEQVQEFLREQEESPLNTLTAGRIAEKAEELRTSQCDLVKDIDNAADALKRLSSKLQNARRELLAKTSSDLQNLQLYEDNVRSLSEMQENLVTVGEQLVEKASDAKLIMKAQEFPTPRTLHNIVQAPNINLPEGNNINSLENTINQLADSLDIKYTSVLALNCGKNRVVGKKGGLDLIKTLRISDSEIVDMVFISSLSQMAMRTADPDAPIKIFDMTGQLVKVIGNGLKELINSEGFALDQRRNLMLAVSGDQLSTVDLEGFVRDVVVMSGCSLKGVAYSVANDQYVVTDAKNHSLHIIEAATKKVSSSFRISGDADNKENGAAQVCVAELQGRATIVVSDWSNHTVKLFDLDGNHVKGFGKEGSADGELMYPKGVVVDLAGRVLVCDTGNRRVVAFWSEGDNDHWRCLLSRQQMGLKPQSLAINGELNSIAVLLDKSVVHLYSLT